MASRINNLRDHQTLIEAFEIIRNTNQNIELHIAGDGEGMDQLRERITGPTNGIFLHGNLSQFKLLDFLQSMDMYVHSTFAETLSTSILQAMSVGLPVVVSRIPGTISMFEDEREGLFFESRNKEDLASKIIFLLENNSRRMEIGKMAREKCLSDYNSEKMFQQYKKLIFSLQKKKG